MANDKTGVVTVDTTLEPRTPSDQQTIEQTAKNFQVVTDEDFKVAGEMIVKAGQHIATVENFFEGTNEEPGIKVLAHRAHKAICDKITKLTAPWRQVRIHLEPRMKTYIKKKDAERRAAEAKLAQEQAAREAEAKAEADRIQRKAEEDALALRRTGQMSAAKAVVNQAIAEAQAVVAEVSEEIGVIVQDNTPKADGVGASRPWTGRVTDPMQVIKAVASGTTPLMWKIPIRGGDGETEEVPLLVVNEKVIKYLGKHLGRPNIGVPGAVGERDLGLRFSKSAPEDYYSPAADPSPADEGSGAKVDW